MNQLALFAKYWEPGKVKTRLGRDLGEEQAAELYRMFLATTLRRCEVLGARRTLVYSPSNRRDDMALLAGANWNLEPQADGNLGQRMKKFFRESLTQSSSPVVLIGSDSPHVPLEYLQKAFELLEKVPVVLGPSEDGGYYLIGLSQFLPELFEGVAWSTPGVLEQTIAKLDASSNPYELLPTCYDIDDIGDLRRLADEIDPSPRDIHLAELQAVLRGSFR